jgi:hypothetical protein
LGPIPLVDAAANIVEPTLGAGRIHGLGDVPTNWRVIEVLPLVVVDVVLY